MYSLRHVPLDKPVEFYADDDTSEDKHVIVPGKAQRLKVMVEVEAAVQVLAGIEIAFF